MTTAVRMRAYRVLENTPTPPSHLTASISADVADTCKVAGCFAPVSKPNRALM